VLGSIPVFLSLFQYPNMFAGLNFIYKLFNTLPFALSGRLQEGIFFSYLYWYS